MFTLKGSVRSLLAAIVAAATGVTFDLSAAGSVRVPSADHASSAVPRSYVDALVQGLVPKGSVRAVAQVADLSEMGLSTGDYSGGVLTAPSNGAMPAIDGVTLAVGDKLLLDITTSDRSYGGIYDVTSIGGAGSRWVLTRAENFNASAEIKPGSYMFVEEGTSFAESIAYLTNNSVPTLDTDALTFLISTLGAGVTAGDGLALSGSTLSVNVGDGIEINADAVRAKIKSGGAVVADGDGLSVQASSASQHGTMSAAHFQRVRDAWDAIVRDDTLTTSGTATDTLALPTCAINTVQEVEVTIIARSTTDASKALLRKQVFASLRGGSGNSSAMFTTSGDELVNLPVPGGIGEIAAVFTPGTDGADLITITGASGHDVTYDVTAKVRYHA